MEPNFSFGHIEVRPTQRQVLVGGAIVPIGARAFDLLMALIERRERVVTRDELLDVVWPGLVVEENNLTVQVGALRKLLGAEAVTTIPGRGYRFTGVADRDEAAPAKDVQGVSRVGALRTNLPEVLAPLIGRDDDLAALATLIVQHRLVTITGTGGVGKTRLAERLAHERRASYAHGVAWVELAGLSDAAPLPGAVAGALGLQIGAGDPLQALAAAVAPLEILVALDNAEHLLDAVAALVHTVLAHAPHVRLIVTSQAPLRVPLERVYRLDGLALPDLDTPAIEAVEYGAVALFVERAQAADRRFEVNALTLPSIVAICSRLDGVALAIGLAAARVPTLGVKALEASLDERMSLLTLGRRGAPERQRTLRAAFDWSHSQLTPVEAAVFRRLGVFAGGFTLELAGEVAHDDDGVIDSWAVTDALASLVDRSLVAADTAAVPRYRLLESARAVAVERLAAAGEEEDRRSRHARALLRRLQAVDDAATLGRMTGDEARLALEVELDNARVALARMLVRGDRLAAVTMAPPISFALSFLRHQERAAMWEATAAFLTDDLPPAARAAWASGYSAFCLNRKPELSMTWARRACALYRELGDGHGLYRALSNLCVGASRRGQVDEARSARREMDALEDADWSPRLRQYGAGARFSLEYHGTGNLLAAYDALQQTHALAERAGDSFNLLATRVNLADLELRAGRADDAVRHGQDIVRDAQGTRQLHILEYARRNLTAALLAQGALPQAAAMARATWPLTVQFEFKHVLADTLSLLALRSQRANAAARLRGYSDALYTANGGHRAPNEAKAAAEVERTVREQLGDAAFERLHAEGRLLSDDQVLALAVGPSD